MLTTAELPAFSTAVLGSTSVCELPILKRSFHDLTLKVEGTGPNGTTLDVRHVIESVELFQSGKSKSLIRPNQFMRYQEFLNATADPIPTNVLFIPLARPGVRGTDWATGDMESFQISVKLKAALYNVSGQSAAAFTRLTGNMTYEPLPAPANRGDVYLHQTISQPAPSAGWNTIDNLTVNNLAALSRLFFMCQAPGTDTTDFRAAAITQVKIRIGEVDVYNQTKAIVETSLVYNPFYKSATSSALTMGFPVMLDRNNRIEDVPRLFDGRSRLPVRVEYYWDTAIAAVAPFDILIEGVEPGTAPAAK